MKKRDAAAMQYSIFTDADWLFPDFPHGQQKGIYLLSPRGGHGGAQILCDSQKEIVPRFIWDGSEGPEV